MIKRNKYSDIKGANGLLRFQIPDRITCMLATSILEEHEQAVGASKSFKLKSSKLLQHMKRLRKSKNESSAKLLEDEHLQADVKISYIDVGSETDHPVLNIQDFLRMLGQCGQLDVLTGGLDLFKACQEFWHR